MSHRAYTYTILPGSPRFPCPRNINVIDNMIKMMEKHAEHLEDLVAERTVELGEEKKKVELLLYSILPRLVVLRPAGLYIGSG